MVVPRETNSLGEDVISLEELAHEVLPPARSPTAKEEYSIDEKHRFT